MHTLDLQQCLMGLPRYKSSALVETTTVEPQCCLHRSEEYDGSRCGAHKAQPNVDGGRHQQRYRVKDSHLMTLLNAAKLELGTVAKTTLYFS